jgi:hypothetical protein
MNEPRRVVERPAGVAGVGPRPVAGLAGPGLAGLTGLADLAELLGGDSPRSRRFLGGLMVGALVGAAVAGGSLLRRGRQPGGR